MLAIYKRDLRSYFHSLTGYVVIAFMVAVVGIYFMAYNMTSGYPYFSGAISGGFLIFFLAVPILTMRCFSEEQKNGTDQLLLTAPVSLWKVVLGKYLAMVTVLLGAVAILAFCPLIIRAYGQWYPRTDYTVLFLFFLLGCVFIAVGMYISSLTKSQIIAAVGTCGLLLVLYLWGSLITFLPSDWTLITGILEKLDVMTCFENAAAYDLLNLDGVFYYLSLIFLFCFLTVQTLKKRRWH